MNSGFRSETFRYKVLPEGADITPLASVEAHIGVKEVRVFNISLGGLALILGEKMDFQVGDPIDLSITIRGRSFPIQVEVKAIGGLRLSCAFVNPSAAFLSALREFLAPKFLGDSLRLNSALIDWQQALELVESSKHYEAYLGQNQTGVFVWMGESRSLLKLMAFSRDLVLGWERGLGLRSGRLQSTSEHLGPEDPNVVWDRVLEITVLNYVSDILLAWVSQNDEAQRLMERLLSGAPLNPSESENIRFPRLDK